MEIDPEGQQGSDVGKEDHTSYLGIQREITKVFEELQTGKVCPYREYEARRLAHPDRTVVLNAITPSPNL